MRTRVTGTVLATIVLALVLVRPADGKERPVVIRTYDASGLSETDRTAAFRAAAAILVDAGLSVERLACDDVRAETATHPCMVPLRPHELSLRLVRLPLVEAGKSPVTLAYALVEARVRVGALATVYVDRVADLAATSGVDLPTLLGRAIAHEIGHLLLGSAAHADRGVMRGVWSPETLHRSPPADWRFTPRDAAALRAAARRRSVHPLQTW